MGDRQLTWKQRGTLWLRLGLRLALAALAVLFVLKLGRPLLSLFAPFLFALAAAAALNPLVKKLQRALGFNRQALTLLLLLLLFGLIGGGLALLTYAAAGPAGVPGSELEWAAGQPPVCLGPAGGAVRPVPRPGAAPGH